MQKRRIVAFVLLAAASASYAAPPQASKEAFKAHLSFLADDLMEGRDPGTRGYDIAAKYVASQFAQYGVQPKGDHGSYQQQVPLRIARAAPDSASLVLQSVEGSESLADGVDFAVPIRASDAAESRTAPLVFVGYGIRNKQMQHDDYAGIDVKGKIVVTLFGYPGNWPSEAGAHLSTTNEKRKTAEELGAVGLVNVWTPTVEKVFPFNKLKEAVSFPTMTWLDAKGVPANNFPSMQYDATISMAAAPKLFARSGLKLEDIYAAAAANKPLPHRDLQLSMKAMRSATRSDIKSSNVVGMIEGSDPKLKNEYVVFSAHLDHLGVKPEKQGDNIYNGAMDNASGVATLLEMARMFSQSPVKPKRSILFIALTGEEKGLLGSAYFANNPTVPASAIVADVNLDMPLLTYNFSSVIAFGAEHSSLKDSVARAARQLNVSLMKDPWPEQVAFVRSDHYNFVKQGIPAISLGTGTTSFNKNEDGAKMWEDFEEHHYHQPSDDMNLPFNFDAAARFTQLNFNIALDVANAKERPSWNKGDFFGDTFKK